MKYDAVDNDFLDRKARRSLDPTQRWSMFALVPITCLLTVFVVLQKSWPTSCWRGPFLSASIVCGILLAAITEFLSLLRLIGSWEILGLWVLGVTSALICLVRINSSTNSLSIGSCLAGISRFEVTLLGSLGVIVITLGVMGWISPPNNWDSMTYHLSRVAHWVQNRSVENYPSHILRQLHQNPWAEFAILHFQILGGSDRFASLIQWFSMIGTTLGVSLLAKQLGASTRGQIFAAVVSVTIPMGVLQGSNTQNDYVVSFWLVCFAYFAILLKENGKPLCSLAVGASLGLAILTKGTAYIYAFPFVVWIGLALLKSRHPKRSQLLLLIAITAIAVNLGHYSRNYDLYGSPLGPGQEGGRRYANDIFSVSTATSNAIRNVGLHIGTPLDGVNTLLENGIYQLHRVIGVDPNDSRTTWPGTEFHISRLSRDEDYAGNLLHVMFIFASIPILMLLLRREKDVVCYFVCLVGAFILFSFYLRWQPWHSRLHLPLFILWSPLIGLSLTKIRFHRMANLSIVILLLGALPFLLKNPSRPILGRESIMTTDRTELYFRKRPSLAEPYISSVRFLSNSQCADLGLVLGEDDWEYPFWVLLGEDARRPIRLEHINVANISKKKYNEYPFNAFTPCAIVMVGDNPADEVHIGDTSYLRKWSSSPVTLFLN